MIQPNVPGRATNWCALFFVAFLVATVAILANRGVAAVQAQVESQLSLRLVAPPKVLAGEVIPLTLQLNSEPLNGSAVQIGGMEAEVRFDAARAEFVGFYPAPVMQSGVGTLLAPQVAGGAVVGYFSCASAECQEVGSVLAEMTRVGSAAADDVLATVEVLPLVEGQIEIRLDNLIIVDRNGEPLAVSLEIDSVAVQVGEGSGIYGAPEPAWETAVARTSSAVSAVDMVAAADVTGDYAVGHADVMETALEWQIAHEQGNPCGEVMPSADLDQDGCVTVADVQRVAANLNASVPGGPVDAGPVSFENDLHLPALSSFGAQPSYLSESDEVADIASGLVFVVNVMTDEPDANIGDGICGTEYGSCTLRAAISEANNNPGPNQIHFNIPGAGIRTIQLTSRLPSLWDSSGGTTINGYTQPGATANTDERVSNAKILIEVRGISETFDAFAVTSSRNVIRGLAIYDFRRVIWVYGSGAKQNYIVGNYLGTDAQTMFSRPNLSEGPNHGVLIEQGAKWNRVGGIYPADRNVISGNRRSGVGMWHWPTGNNLVQNNLIGLSADGTWRVANLRHGIDMNFGVSSNTIGGRSYGQRNVVSGNGFTGIEISHGEGTAKNVVIGNFIGTDVSGNAIGEHTQNGGYGVFVKDRVQDNLVTYNIIANGQLGGVLLDNLGNCCLAGNVIEYNRIGIGLNDAALGNNGDGIYVIATTSRIGPGNIIAHNSGGGIVIAGNANDGNTITENAIFANGGLGIDLAPVGSVNANDPGDGDNGPNQQLNYPEITLARPDKVNGNTCAFCRVEIFIATGQSGEHGSGKVFVGAGNANVNGWFTIPVSGVLAGDNVTATATDEAGNTSEFAANVPAQW